MGEFVGLKYWITGRYIPAALEDWSDLYEVSRSGEVVDKQTGETLKERHQYKRVYVVLTREGKAKKRWLHKCVATSFPECGEYGEGYEVDHISSDPLDNRAENLRWVSSHKENMNNPATKEKILKAKKKKKTKKEPEIPGVHNPDVFRKYLLEHHIKSKYAKCD